MNYIDFNREDLLAALSSVKPGLATKEVLAQSSKFVFKDKCVVTFNEEIAVSHPIQHDITCAVPAIEFYDYLFRMNDAIIGICVDEHNIHIKGSKNLKASIKIDAEINLPLEDIKFAESWNPIPVNFSEAIEFALLSVSSDLSKPVLTCVHWTPTYIESCDNFRLTRYKINAPSLPASILLSSKIVAHLKTYVPVAFSVVDEWAHFKTSDDCIFSCRIYPGKYVDLDAVCGGVFLQEIMFTDAVMDMLNRVSVLAEKDIYGNSKAIMKIENGMATVIAMSEKGEATEGTRIKCDADISFDFKIETLLHILKHFKLSLMDDKKSALRFQTDEWTHVISLC